MRIISIESATFGTLNITEPVALGPGLNILTAPNQAGKSTLLTLVEWLLYGVPPRGKRRSQTDVDHWRPWSGGKVAATLVIQPQHSDWPTQVTVTVDFEDFVPRVTDAGTLAEIDSGLFTVDRNGTWDIGQRLTGLGREAFRLSLLAPQEEMDAILKDDELRRLLTADLAGLVEDPERATLDHSLADLEKPSFTMGELSKGPVQMGKLMREATNHWQLAAGDLDHQQERYQQLESELTQCELAESELGEFNGQVVLQEQQLAQQDLAAAHWRFDQVTHLEQQGVDWTSRLEREPWLKDFPSGLQRDVDTWIADRRNISEQVATAEAHARDAAALKLRAPYVDKVNIDITDEVIRNQEKLCVLRNEILTHSGRLCESKERMEGIEAYLERHREKERHVGQVTGLAEQLSAIMAAGKDWDNADELVREYGEERDATERLRLEELDAFVKPYRSSVPQVADYIEWSAGLEQSRTEQEQLKRELDAKVESNGKLFIIAGIIAIILGLALAALGYFTEVFEAWMGYVGGGVLVVLGGWLTVAGFTRASAAKKAAAELAGTVVPALKELTERGEKCTAQAQRIQVDDSMTPDTWKKLVEIVPEYQHLRLSLEQYAQALRDREGAGDRRTAAWEEVRALYPLAGEEPDPDWLAEQIGILKEYRKHTQRRMDEHSKLLNEENELGRAGREESEIIGRLTAEFEPLGLVDTLRKDADAAVSQFKKMVADTRQWHEHQRDAAEQDRLSIRSRDLAQKLIRLLVPIGLDDLARQDQDTAIREYEIRRDEARRFGEYDGRLVDAREQLRHLGLTRDEFDARWEALSANARKLIESAVTTEAGYDALIAKQRETTGSLEQLRREVDQKRSQVDKLRQAVARDEDVRDALELASLRQHETRVQLDSVRTWQRALELLRDSLTEIQHQLAGNLAPRLTEELRLVLQDSPVQHVTDAGLNGQLELQLNVSGAPAGLSSEELLERLSVGARRQLALALRVAVARALGEERSTLMLLDEPLAELDDERAVNCLRYIARLAKEHQVLLTTCHAEHQAWLMRESGVEARTISLG